MKTKISLVLASISLILLLVACSGNSSQKAETAKPASLQTQKVPQKPAEPVQNPTVNVFLDSSFMSDVIDIFAFARYKKIFEKNHLTIGYLGYTKDYKPADTKSSGETLDIHIGVFGTMLDEYAKDSSIKWVGTIGRGTEWYGATTLKTDEFSKIKTVGLTGSGNDIDLLGTLLLARFGVDPTGVTFVNSGLDGEKFKALDAKKIDLSFFKANSREESAKKYTILDPKSGTSLYPFRTMYIKEAPKDPKLLRTFLTTYNQTKQEIIANSLDFKKYLEATAAPAFKTAKGEYYKELIASFIDVDSSPNKKQMRDAIDTYVKLRNTMEIKLGLDGLIYNP